MGNADNWRTRLIHCAKEVYTVLGTSAAMKEAHNKDQKG